MIWPSLLLATAVAGLAIPAASSGDDPLAGHRWRSRVLVVIAPDPTDSRLAEQRRLFALAQGGNRERDLVTVEGVGGGLSADRLRARFGVAPGAFRAVLVGRDGGAKLVSAEPLAADRLFAEIDSMPMRRDEMRRQAAHRSAR